MQYWSRAAHPTIQGSTAGEKEETTYEIQVDVRGHKKLVESGKTNVYDLIQESLEETKIENIIRRALGGDQEALAVMHGQYIDVTEAPKTLAEMQQAIIAATNEFNKLPLEYRAKFNHSPEQFVAEYGTEGWIEKMKAPETLKTEAANNGDESKQ